MKSLTSASLLPRLLVSCAVALGLSALPAPAEAGKSHLNRKSSQHVTLVWSAIAGATLCPVATDNYFGGGSGGVVLGDVVLHGYLMKGK